MKKRNRRRSISRSSSARRTQFEALEPRCLLSVTPTLVPTADLTLYEGAPINLPLDAIYDLEGPLTYTVECSDPNVNVYVPEGNRSMKISVSAENGAITGDMIFELFEGRAPRVTNQIISLAEDGFYDGLIFHRIIDNFMIQGGDPTGTGSGGSYLENFDDQFHLELMHTSTGVLSMAKVTDDTNSSQFFITEGTARHLDFNHSVFGQLIEGEAIREALSGVDTQEDDPNTTNVDESTQPLNAVTMESVEIFEDTENAVLVINAPHDYSGSSSVTITVTIHDQSGNEYVQTPINVTIQEDIENSIPFFSDFPTMQTAVNTPYVIDLSAYVQDVEGLLPFVDPNTEENVDENQSVFLDAYKIYNNGIDPPYLQDEDLAYAIDFYTGIATFTPSNDMVGTYPFPVATGNSPDTLDIQVAALNIVPTEAPDSSIAMTFVTEPTTVDAQGEVNSLPADAEWVHAWEECSVEVWAKIDDPGQFGIYSVETDLTFYPDQYQVKDIEWGVGFNQEQTGTVDNVNGTITGLGGTTKGYTVIPYQETIGYLQGHENAYPSSGAEDLVMWGDDKYVLVARVNLEPVATSSSMIVQPDVGYNTPTAAIASLSQGDVKWNAVDGTDVAVDTEIDTEIWPVIYDLDGNGMIDLVDLSQLISVFHIDLDAPGNHWGYACDLNRDGVVDLVDFGEMVSRFYYRAGPGTTLVFQPPGEASQAAALMGTQSASLMGTQSVALMGTPSASQMGTQSASLMGMLTASDLAQHFGEDHNENDDDQTNATDLIMALYGDA